MKELKSKLVQLAAQQKNNETQAEVEKLKEQITIQAAERESDKEKIQHLEQQLENTSNKIREELRQEFFSLLAQHKQAPAHVIQLLNC